MLLVKQNEFVSQYNFQNFVNFRQIIWILFGANQILEYLTISRIQVLSINNSHRCVLNIRHLQILFLNTLLSLNQLHDKEQY